MTILSSMLKEEWRIHSTMFGSFMFALFPAMLVAFSFVASLFIPALENILPGRQIWTIAHYMFVLFGVSVGGFGLFGREVMNRRFGHASLIAYSARTLPVSEKEIFSNFFVKDLTYYFVLWVLPIAAGFAIATPFLGIRIDVAGILFVSLALSFMTGLSAIFLLSTIYAHSSKFFISAFAVLSVAALAAGYSNFDAIAFLPALSFFFKPSWNVFFSSILIASVPSIISLIYFKSDYPTNLRTFKNSFASMSNRLTMLKFANFAKYPEFIAKDFLDLKRSEGGAGKIIFSFLFPVGLIWLMLFAALEIMPAANFFVIFAILLGAISSMVYNWLTEFDLFSAYAFLPVRVTDVIKSKLASYAIINSISIAILIIAALKTDGLYYFIPALFSFLSVSSYSLAITVYLGGLYPNILLYNAKVFSEYILSISPVLLILIVLSMFNPLSLLACPVLIPVSYRILKKSFAKWNTWEHPSF